MANLQIIITGKDLASDALEDLDGQLQSLGDTASEAGKAIALGIAGTIAGLAAAVGLSVKKAAEFEQSLADTASATGATADEMKAMRKEALGIGKDTSKSASEAAAAMGELVKAGMSTETVVGGAARAVVQLAEATGSDVTEMASLVSNGLNTFSADGLKAADIATLIARTANASAIGTSDLAQSLQAAGPIAAQAGLSATDFATAIGLLGNHALRGSDAGTSLKTMLLALTAPTDAAKSELDRLGVSMFDAQGRTRPFRDVLGELQSALSGASDEQQAMTLKTIFGTDAIRAANILLGEGTSGWDAFTGALAAAPTLAEQSATRLGTLNGQIEQLKGSLETIAIGVGTVLLPALTGITTGILAGFNWLISQDWTTVNGNLHVIGANVENIAGAVFKLSGINVAGIGTGFMSLANGSSDALAGLTTRFTEAFFNTGIPAIQWTQANAPAAFAQLTSTVGTVSSGLVTIAESFQKFHDTGTSAINAAEKMVLTADPLAIAIGKVVLSFTPLGPAVGLASLAFPLFKEAYEGNLGGFGTFVDNTLKPAFDRLAGAAKKALSNDTAGALTDVGDTFRDELPEFVRHIGVWAQSFLDWVRVDILPQIGPRLAEFWDAITGWLAETSRDLPTKLLDWSAAFLNWLSTDVIPKIGSELGKFLDSILTWVRKDENMAAITTALDHWVASFLGFFEFQVIPKLGPEVLKLVGAIGKFVFEANTKIAEIGLRIAGAILGGIAQGLMRNAEAVVGTALRNALKLAFPAVAGMIDSVFSAKAGSSGGVDLSGTGVLKGPDGTIVNVPKFGAGGIVTRPTLAMIGERGPEAVVPLGGGIGSAVNFYGPVYGLSDLQDKIVEMMTLAERRGRVKAGTMSA